MKHNPSKNMSKKKKEQKIKDYLEGGNPSELEFDRQGRKRTEDSFNLKESLFGKKKKRFLDDNNSCQLPDDQHHLF